MQFRLNGHRDREVRNSRAGWNDIPCKHTNDHCNLSKLHFPNPPGIF